MYNNQNNNQFAPEVPIYNFVSPKYAIRGAIGNLGFGHLIQNLEDEFIRWAGEANQKTTADTRAETIYTMLPTYTAFTKNGRIKLQDGMRAIECLKLNNVIINFTRAKCRCTQTCINGCSIPGTCINNCPANNCTCGGCYTFELDGCWAKFNPSPPDGMQVCIEAWGIPYDEDGYVSMIEGSPITAAQFYIGWQLCVRQADNRATSQMQQWLFNCRQARAYLNKPVKEDMELTGRFWNPGFMSARHFQRRGGNVYW